jgi:hypothetical protein
MNRNEQNEQNHNQFINEGDGRLVVSPEQADCSNLKVSRLPLNSDNYTVQKPANFGYCYATGGNQGNKFDTLLLAIPDSIILKSARKGKVLGLQYVRYNYKKKYEIWQCSAKILKGNYFDLIHKGNIASVIDAINHSGLIEVKVNGFCELVKVLRADFTCDIKVKNLQELLLALSTCCIRSNYQRQRYQRDFVRETVLFISTSENRNSMCFYDKYEEMLRHPQDEILQYVNLEDAKNLLRVECRFKKLKGFRNVIGIPQINHSLYLNDLLETNTNVFLMMFSQIVDFALYTEKPTGNKHIVEKILHIPKLNESYKFAYWYLVYKFFAGDKDNIDSYLRLRFKRPSIAKEQYTKYLPKIIAFTDQNTKSKIVDLIGLLNEPYNK